MLFHGLAVLLSLFPLHWSADQELRPEELILAYMEAHNCHDVEAALAFLAEDIRLGLPGVWIKEGKAEIRSLEQWDAAINGQLRFCEIEVDGDTVTCTSVESNDWFRLAGIDEIGYDSVVITTSDGQIAGITAVISPEGAEQISTALGAVIAWASEERAEVPETLMPGGEFIYSAEAAERWLALLHEWRQATQNGCD